MVKLVEVASHSSRIKCRAQEVAEKKYDKGYGMVASERKCELCVASCETYFYLQLDFISVFATKAQRLKGAQ